MRAVIVTGRGRAFCAGFDLSGQDGFDVYQRAIERGTEEVRPGDIVRDSGGLIAVRMFRCLKPIIGAINGVGVGFGATFPLPMDVRLASETRTLRLRLQPARDVHGRGVELVPAARGRDQPRDGVVVRAAASSTRRRRSRPGLVRSLYAPDDLMPAARELAKSMISDSAPVSVALNRQLLWQMLGARASDGGAPHGVDLHRRARAIRRRRRRRAVVPREAPAARSR